MRITCILSILLIFFACKDDEDTIHCSGFGTELSSPYDDPVWHPSGAIIGFNHRPIKEINYIEGYDCPYQADYVYEDDSAGFWLINADGTNQRRALPYMLDFPAWSPDGKQIAFSYGAQICIMPFDGINFDTTAIVKLTFEGRNFTPSWRSDGKWIAYYESICNDIISCGIWVYHFQDSIKQLASIYGMFPSWHPYNDSLIFLRNALTNNGVDVGDSIWIFNNKTKASHFLRYISLPNCDNRFLSYSQDAALIAFTSLLNNGNGIQLFAINADGSGLLQLTTEGCECFSWSPENKIVYLNFGGERIDDTKGTLWIMNADGTSKHQLTRNLFKLTQ